MSQNPAEILRATLAKWAVGDFDTAEVFDPLICFVVGRGFPDSGTYLGRDAVAGYMRHFLEPWTRVTIAAEEIVEAGDSFVVSVLQSGAGTGSGAATDFRYLQVWTFRGPMVVRWENFREREDALAAVGLA